MNPLYLVAIFDPGVYQPHAGLIAGQDDWDRLLAAYQLPSIKRGWSWLAHVDFADIRRVRSVRRLRYVGSMDAYNNDRRHRLDVYAHKVEAGRPVIMAH